MMYWTSIELAYDQNGNKGGGWILRDRHASIDKAVAYAERMNMMSEGRVVIMQEVAEVRYHADILEKR